MGQLQASAPAALLRRLLLELLYSRAYAIEASPDHPGNLPLSHSLSTPITAHFWWPPSSETHNLECLSRGQKWTANHS